MTTIKRLSLFASAMSVNALVYGSALAQNFAGPTPNIPGTPGATNQGQIRDIIGRILIAVLNFLGLIAVIVVIIAGIRLIVSQGEEEPKEKAKKTILYALMGLIIVLFARVIVGLVTQYLAQEVNG